MGRAELVMNTNKCKTYSQAAKNSREVKGTLDGQEQTDAKDLEKLPKINRKRQEDQGGSWEQQTSTTLKIFSLSEPKRVRTLY